MATEEQIKQLIESNMNAAELMVRVDGSHCVLAVASDEFEGLRTIKKQQLIYACLNDLIASGELHAVTMHTYTPKEWDAQRPLGFPGF